MLAAPRPRRSETRGVLSLRTDSMETLCRVVCFVVYGHKARTLQTNTTRHRFRQAGRARMDTDWSLTGHLRPVSQRTGSAGFDGRGILSIGLTFGSVTQR